MHDGKWQPVTTSIHMYCLYVCNVLFFGGVIVDLLRYDNFVCRDCRVAFLESRSNSETAGPSEWRVTARLTALVTKPSRASHGDSCPFIQRNSSFPGDRPYRPNGFRQIACTTRANGGTLQPVEPPPPPATTHSSLFIPYLCSLRGHSSPLRALSFALPSNYLPREQLDDRLDS